jgi:hypothetical protein
MATRQVTFSNISSSPRVVATAGNYLGLIAALRARIAELGISYATLDAIAGWTDTYATKLLAEEPQKYFGPMSFDAMLGSLGIKIALVEDPAKLEKVKKNRDFVPRQLALPTTGKHAYVVQRKTRENMREMSREAARARMEKIPPRKRSALARKAAKARWRKPRVEAG